MSGPNDESASALRDLLGQIDVLLAEQNGDQDFIYWGGSDSAFVMDFDYDEPAEKYDGVALTRDRSVPAEEADNSPCRAPSYAHTADRADRAANSHSFVEPLERLAHWQSYSYRPRLRCTVCLQLSDDVAMYWEPEPPSEDQYIVWLRHPQVAPVRPDYAQVRIIEYRPCGHRQVSRA